MLHAAIVYMPLFFPPPLLPPPSLFWPLLVGITTSSSRRAHSIAEDGIFNGAIISTVCSWFRFCFFCPYGRYEPSGSIRTVWTLGHHPPPAGRLMKSEEQSRGTNLWVLFWPWFDQFTLRYNLDIHVVFRTTTNAKKKVFNLESGRLNLAKVIWEEKGFELTLLK